jgi:dihydroorotate dehydrogenase electron transfer subunit
MTQVREIATVTANDADGDASLLRLRSPRIAATARPFQFVLVKVPAAGFLLRRPLSVFDAGGDEVALLVRPAGEGTGRLRRLAPGESCDLTGPFGREFEAPEGSVFVAGGIGVAGVFFALAAAARSGSKVELVYGAQAAAELYAKRQIDELKISATFVTEDGSSGRKGLATDFIPGIPSREAKLMAGALEEDLPFYNRAVIACGPRPMYAALRNVLGDGARWYVLMEERMACGVGACRSCVVPVREPAGSYAAVCKEGPLVDAAAVDWGRLGEEI